jgi:hypothetical protein
MGQFQVSVGIDEAGQDGTVVVVPTAATRPLRTRIAPPATGGTWGLSSQEAVWMVASDMFNLRCHMISHYMIPHI